MVSGIGAVSSLGLSTGISSVQQALTPQTKAQLEKLGIDTTNINTEEQGQAALKSAQASQKNENTQNSSASQNIDQANKASSLIGSQSGGQGQAPTWVSLMEKNGISPTGSIDGDKQAVTSALSRMDSTQAQSLAAQFQAAGLSVKAPDNSQQTNAQKSDPFTGQNQLSELNKFFLIKQKVA